AARRPPPAARSVAWPAVRASDDAVDRAPLARSARLPTLAWQAARDALANDLPVLVQVPRGGYQPALSCERCRLPARCPACAGPLGRRGPDSAPACGWCGVVAAAWRCPHC